MSSHLRAAAIIRFVIASLEMSGALLFFVLGAAIWDPHSWTRIFSTILLALTVFLGAHGALGAVAAYGLLERRPWGRVLGIITAVLEITGFPIGTALGGYTLWVLLQPETAKLFAEAQRPPQLPRPQALPAPPPQQPASLDLKWD